jgi:HSP20 family protein
MALKDLIPFGRKGEPAPKDQEHPFTGLQREMNQLFENFFRGFSLAPFEERYGTTFMPRVDVAEDDKAVTVKVELPGMSESDIDVSVSKDALTLRGEKQEDKEEKGKNFYRRERSYGSFSRTVPLPAGIDTDRVAAAFKKGVLTVTLPRTQPVAGATKKIPVKTG